MGFRVSGGLGFTASRVRTSELPGGGTGLFFFFFSGFWDV